MLTIEAGMPVHYPTLLKIWESSVRATHDFLPEEEIQALRPLLENLYFPGVTLSMARLVAGGAIVGFVGVSEKRIEMLFVDAAQRGKGIGKALLHHAIVQQGADELDVNEQNPQAVSFYQQQGFKVVGRSEQDGQGRPYPLLHMKLQRMK
ncbi:GNAT family N-acetyltransferase [Kosakonia cowanii]|uniref:GNAT family N-acetyltransferase n=1 Tax=Kosakonia cowanii TaxID=208223 RepID=UPI0023F7EAA8|nr:GNAT family N-acetyltransferase [Kosakonia cowanii]MDF7759743.1 GNAT family N-acetyltransferase [Kosakonia cowanii]